VASPPEFGNLLFEHRKRAGLTQRQLADLIGVDYTYISKIEAGRTPPPARETIERAATVLSLSAAQCDELLLAAEKVPSDVAQLFAEEPKVMQLFRTLHAAPEGERGQLVERFLRSARKESKARGDGGSQ
jgi:HTH-type transcriptional regulator, competence development regulator